MRLTLEFGDWIKEIFLPNMGGSHAISWKPKQNKKADPPWVIGKSSCLLPNYLWARIALFFFLPLNPNWNIFSSCVSSMPAFRLELHYNFYWSLVYWLQILGVFNIHNYEPIPFSKSLSLMNLDWYIIIILNNFAFILIKANK
jgi:hypothetical protein